jgi:hypothetical protein
MGSPSVLGGDVPRLPRAPLPGLKDGCITPAATQFVTLTERLTAWLT